MFQEMTTQELMAVDGGMTLGQLLWAMGKGALAGTLSGAMLGSVVPGGGTVAGALAGFVIGAGGGAFQAVIDEVGGNMVDKYIH